MLDADDDPFADLLAEPKVTSPAPATGVADPFDAPLAPPPMPPVPQPAGRGGQSTLDDFSDLTTPIDEKTPSIDNLFRAEAGGGTAMGSDPLAGSPLAEPLH